MRKNLARAAAATMLGALMTALALPGAAFAADADNPSQKDGVPFAVCGIDGLTEQVFSGQSLSLSAEGLQPRTVVSISLKGEGKPRLATTANDDGQWAATLPLSSDAEGTATLVATSTMRDREQTTCVADVHITPIHRLKADEKQWGATGVPLFRSEVDVLGVCVAAIVSLFVLAYFVRTSFSRYALYR